MLGGIVVFDSLTLNSVAYDDIVAVTFRNCQGINEFGPVDGNSTLSTIRFVDCELDPGLPYIIRLDNSSCQFLMTGCNIESSVVGLFFIVVTTRWPGVDIALVVITGNQFEDSFAGFFNVTCLSLTECAGIVIGNTFQGWRTGIDSAIGTEINEPNAYIACGVHNTDPRWA